MDYDLKIVRGRIVDGTGKPSYAGEVAVKDGVITAVGDAPGEARETIDAKGAVVSPGFIDCHTHYDAQAFWDPMLSPSVYHGVTTVLAGNCGFTLAPLTGRKEDTDYLIAMLARVEGMPLASLEAALAPDWKSFGEFLDRIDGKLAINTAFLVGHSALRRHVMGDRAVGHPASEDELEAMADLLRKSLSEGGCGFSTTASYTHHDHNGDPVPSRWAKEEEYLALSAVCRDFPGTWLELIPPTGGPDDPDARYRVPTAMSLAAQRPVNWNTLLVRAEAPAHNEAALRMGRYAAERGGRVLGLAPAVPMKNMINFRTGTQIELLEGWHDFMELEDDRKLEAMKDRELRKQLLTDAKRSHARAGLPKGFGDYRIEYVASEKNAKYVGRHLDEIGAETGRTAFDVLFDTAIEENLAFSFSPPPYGADDASWRLRGEVWRDPHTLVGGSDAGAHLDSINTFAICTQFLSESVRRRELFTLEEGVRLITGRLADLFGLKGRGRIEVGAAADLVVFDPSTVDCGPIEMRQDLPGGETRLYADSVGIHHVVVNGVPVAGDNAPTGRMGGRVLRGGQDTQTVPIGTE